MIIQFNYIRLNNFMSFLDEIIPLDDLGYVLVSGRNNNKEDLAYSNGSGKSSIWEGIVWALTGETIRGNKNVTNLYGNDGALVELNFHIDNDCYHVIRTKNHSKFKSGLQIEINGEDKSGKGLRDSESLLKQYLPDLTHELISSVIVLGQGLPQRFTNNTPAGRKQVLEQLSNSDFMITDLKQRLSKRKDFWDDSFKKVSSKKISLQSSIDILNNQIEKYKQSLLQFESLEDLSVKLEEKNTEAAEQKKILDKTTELINSYSEQIQDTENKYLDTKSESVEKIDEIVKKHQPKLEKVLNDINKLQVEIDYTKKEIRRLEQIKDVCPTCGQKLVGVEKPDITPYTESCKELQEKLSSLLTEQRSLQDVRDLERQRVTESYNEKLTNFSSCLEQAKREKIKLENEKVTTQKYLDKCQEEIYSIKLKIDSSSTQKQTIEQSIQECLKDLANAEEEILYYTNEGENIQKHLDVVNKMDTLIKRDFRGYLLTNVIQFINEKLKEYSSTVFNNARIEFQQSGNNISITYEDKEYEALSGGEQKKLDIIIQLSIRDMLCRLLNFSSNILVCDELFDSLDSLGCQNIIDLVSTKLNDISSIFIVTHRDNLSIPCDKEIVVVKDENKISHVIQET